MRVRALFVTVALVGALVACSSGDDDDGPAASVSRTSSSTTSTTVGVDEVPEEITVEYVQRVMDALDASWGDMYRLYVSSGGPTAETAAWLDALYDEPELSRIDEGLGREAADGFPNTVSPPRDPNTEVRELLSVDAECIYLVVDRRYDEILVGPPTADATTAMALRRYAQDEHNPTAWAIALELLAPERMPEDPCVG